MTLKLLSLFLFHIFIITPFGAADGIAAVEIALSTPGFSWTVDPITVTIWFDHVVYQYPLVTDASTKTYTTTSLSVLGKYECASSNPPSKIMFSNPGADGLMMDEIKITTTSGTWYGIQGRCIDDLFMVTQSWVVDSDGYEDWYTAEPLCDSGNSNIWICIDNQDTDCGPAKQVLYFDTSRPNQYINDADWSEGGTVSASVGTCPTPQPTNNPTAKPTTNPSEPTHDPTSKPTNQPTAKPTRNPTSNPTNKPTSNPTTKPTGTPTSSPIPTAQPSRNPTTNPTNKPTPKPTNTPTYKPTRSPTANPTPNPTDTPTLKPTRYPTSDPTNKPTSDPTRYPTAKPTHGPTRSPTKVPTEQPTDAPVPHPTRHPITAPPTSLPTDQPTRSPTTAEPTTKRPTLLPTDQPARRPTLNAGAGRRPTAPPVESTTISAPSDAETTIDSQTEAPFIVEETTMDMRTIVMQYIVFIVGAPVLCCVCCLVVFVFYKRYVKDGIISSITGHSEDVRNIQMNHTDRVVSTSNVMPMQGMRTDYLQTNNNKGINVVGIQLSGEVNHGQYDADERVIDNNLCMTAGGDDIMGMDDEDVMVMNEVNNLHVTAGGDDFMAHDEDVMDNNLCVTAGNGRPSSNSAMDQMMAGDFVVESDEDVHVTAGSAYRNGADPNFERMLGDEMMVQGMVMDDIVDEMDGNPDNVSQNAFVTPM
eukprot:144439_1